jgi:hypothetical protein
MRLHASAFAAGAASCTDTKQAAAAHHDGSPRLRSLAMPLVVRAATCHSVMPQPKGVANLMRHCVVSITIHIMFRVQGVGHKCWLFVALDSAGHPCLGLLSAISSSCQMENRLSSSSKYLQTQEPDIAAAALTSFPNVLQQRPCDDERQAAPMQAKPSAQQRCCEQGACYGSKSTWARLTLAHVHHHYV